ncbi:MAG TPA: alpha/beta fold hydrolase [Xanthomonadaceae bacterium]|nr:alpha/beta fold hydrolase [Xanthomonadaceae bacterium]
MSIMIPRPTHPPDPTDPHPPRASVNGLDKAATRPSTASPLVFLLFGLLLGLTALATEVPADLRLLRALGAGDFETATADFSPLMREHLDAARMAEVWAGVTASLGALGEIEPLTEQAQGELRVSTLRLHFAQGALDAQVASDEAGVVHGLYFRPAPPPAPEPGEESPREVELDSGATGWPLPALLTVPEGEGPFPAVVLVHGSGPQDRDLSIGANRPFRDIAHGLARRGVASLRYHKRTHVHAERLSIESPAITLEEEVVADALAALAKLSELDDIDGERRFVLGLSLGALLAPRIGERAADIAGIVMLAPSARPLHEIIPAQVRYIAELDGIISEAEAEGIRRAEALRDAIAKVLAGEDVDIAWTGAPAEYWRDLDAYDALGTAAALDLPILLLQGERDYQVTIDDDFVLWRRALEGRPRAELHVLPGLNHLFIAGEGPSGPAEYLRPGRVDDGALDLIAAWIRRQSATTQGKP